MLSSSAFFDGMTMQPQLMR